MLPPMPLLLLLMLPCRDAIAHYYYAFADAIISPFRLLLSLY